MDQRKLIWIALSHFYLDTELQESDFLHMAQKIIESPYSLEEVKEINKYEVFPVLQPNLLSVAGEWTGFNEEWLVNAIVASNEHRTAAKKLEIDAAYLVFNWMCKDYWKKLESALVLLKSKSDSGSPAQ